MNKQKKIVVGIFHLIWMIGLCLCGTSVEYGVLNLVGAFGMNILVVANVLVGTLIFLLFYWLEKRLIEQELSMPVLFAIASYIGPIAYHWFMARQYAGVYGTEDAEVLTIIGIFSFTSLYFLIGLLVRGMTALYLYLNKKMSENRPLHLGQKRNGFFKWK